jgi:transcriptional regulator GlxA family with amidase domain
MHTVAAVIDRARSRLERADTTVVPGFDVCLALVAADHGADVAAVVARRLVMPLHRAGGQAQCIDAPIEPPAAELLDWSRERLAEGPPRCARSSRRGTEPRASRESFAGRGAH